MREVCVTFKYWVMLTCALRAGPLPQVKYHINTVLIQDIKELLSQNNVFLYHTLREENQCADFFIKHGASSDDDFLTMLLLHKVFVICLGMTQ
jgi:hypothetical protein